MKKHLINRFTLSIFIAFAFILLLTLYISYLEKENKYILISKEEHLKENICEYLLKKKHGRTYTHVYFCQDKELQVGSIYTSDGFFFIK